MTQKEFYDFREENNTRQVSLLRLVKGALKNWKLILLAGILLGGLLGSYKVFTIRSQKDTMIEEYDNYKAKLDAYKTSIKDYKTSIADYQESIASLSDYCENSPKMKMDAYHCPTATLDLKVAAPADGSITEDEITAVKNALYNEVYFGNTLNEVASKRGMTVSDLRELVTFKLTSTGSTMRLTVISENEEEAEAIRDDVLSALETKHKAIAAAMGDYSIKVFNKGTQTITDTSLQSYQQKQQDALAKLQTTCYTAQNQSTNLVKPPAVPQYSKKYMLMNGIKMAVVGFAGGIILAMIVLMARIVQKGVILTPDEIDGEYGLRTLADLSGKSAAQKTEMADYALARIGNVLGKDRDHRIGIVGTAADKRLESLAGILNKKSAASGSGNAFVHISGIMTDAEALKSAAGMDEIILAEEIGKSDYETVRKEIALIAESGKPILGTVYF